MSQSQSDEFAKAVLNGCERAQQIASRLPQPIASIAVSTDGHSIDIHLTNESSPYSEWIKGEGGDIGLLRDRDTNKVVGAHLPFYAKTLYLSCGEFETYIDVSTGHLSPAEPPQASGELPRVGYKAIAVTLAAFCARLHGREDVSPQIGAEAIKLAHEFKAVERHNKSLTTQSSAQPASGKERLGSGDEPGWYLCDFVGPDERRAEGIARYWDGKELHIGYKHCPVVASNYTNFVRLVPAASPAVFVLTPDEWQRLHDWSKDPRRKPADVAFTSGVLRDAADAVQGSLADFSPTVPATPAKERESEQLQEESVDLNDGEWKVRIRGESLQIIDPQGRCRHSSRGHMMTGLHFAGLLSERSFGSAPNLDAAMRMQAERFASPVDGQGAREGKA